MIRQTAELVKDILEKHPFARDGHVFDELNKIYGDGFIKY